MIKLDIISDPICPWCFIGWSYLSRALEARPNHPFAIEWHPFQLNPDMPAEGMARREYLELKFGGKSGAASAYAPVVEHGATAGLNWHLDKIQRTPSTLNAHRLIHWAGIEQRQTPVVKALFQAYFVDGRDIGDKAVLAEIAGANGLDQTMIETLLAGDADADDIQARDRHSRSRGVQGVPCFVIAGQHVLSGAQPTATWLEIIDDVTQQLQAQEAAAAGPS